MRAVTIALLLVVASPAAAARRASFVRVVVTAPPAARVHVLWRPYAGAVTSRGEHQQAALYARRRVTHPDSLRRWRDPAACDTVRLALPAELVVDMSGGPVLLEALERDSVRAEVQLSPRRGPVITAWGRTLQISTDRRAPRVVRRR